MTWADFKAAIIHGFVPADHERKARDHLRRVKQTKSVAKYLADFRNIILTINGMRDDEKIDHFIQRLKYNVRVEVLKAQSASFEECVRVSLKIDSAI